MAPEAGLPTSPRGIVGDKEKDNEKPEQENEDNESGKTMIHMI